MSTTTTTTTTPLRGDTLDALFAGRPWWEGTAIQFLCRMAAYGGYAALEGDVGLPGERFVWAVRSARERPAVLRVIEAHRAEIAAVLERCPGRRFPWWD